MDIRVVHGVDVIKPLLEESEREGFRFLRRLVDEYESGSNRFDQPGEVLMAAFFPNKEVVAVGGLNRDPYLLNEKIGRVRRFYVSPSYRGRGVGNALLQALVRHGKEHFNVLTLYTDTKKADLFYRRCGFTSCDEFPNVTHVLRLT